MLSEESWRVNLELVRSEVSWHVILKRCPRHQNGRTPTGQLLWGVAFHSSPAIIRRWWLWCPWCVLMVTYLPAQQ